MKHHLNEKREELIWALSLQGYSLQDIAEIFGLKSKWAARNIVEQKPKDWRPKWQKVV